MWAVSSSYDMAANQMQNFYGILNSQLNYCNYSLDYKLYVDIVKFIVYVVVESIHLHNVKWCQVYKFKEIFPKRTNAMNP